MQTTRDETFIPLTPGQPPTQEPPDFRVTVQSQAGHSQTFHSLERKGTPSSGMHAPGCEPRISVQQEGDRIASIRIQCVCGQVLELACLYEERKESGHSSPSPSPLPASAPAATIVPTPPSNTTPSA